MEKPFRKTGQQQAAAETAPAELTLKTRVEDTLTRELEREAAGEVLGGAIGQVSTCIDLILYDGARSREIAREVLNQSGLGGSWRLEPFTEK